MFVIIKKRFFPIVLVGFVTFTFLTYYHSTFDDSHTYPQLKNISSVKILVKVTNEGEILPTQYGWKNMTIELSTANTSSNKGSITDTGPPIVVASQSSSVNTSTNQKSINEMKRQENIVKKLNAQNKKSPAVSRPVIDKNLVNVIYTPGHSITVPEKCPNNGTKKNLVIVIMSAPAHYEARMGIRQTWGHYAQRTDVSIVFILGTSKNTTEEASLKKEENLYADIIRGNFVDSYTNLTLKTLSTLEWFHKYCSKAKFLLKTDDDMFINIQKLLSFIMEHKKDSNVIFGRVAKKWKPYRNKQSKYYVPPAQFNNTVFPDFTTGPAYLLSRDVIDRLYNTAMKQTYMKLEDVFITGVIAAKLGIKRVHVGEFLNKKISHQPCTIQRSISIHMVKYAEQFDVWKKLLDGKSKCK